MDVYSNGADGITRGDDFLGHFCSGRCWDFSAGKDKRKGNDFDSMVEGHLSAVAEPFAPVMV